ncbi:hypothetical protein B0T13DRAFT_400564, partial [Neurospora crassa]
FKYVTITINWLIKIKYCIPTAGLTAEKLVKRFIERVYSIYNLPDSIVFNCNT